MKLQVVATAIATLFIMGTAQAQYTPTFSMTSISWEDETTFWMNGARIVGLGLTANDEANIKYTFSKADGNFVLSDATVVVGAGVVLQDANFTSAEVSPLQPQFVVNGNFYTAGTTSRNFSATAAAPFVATMVLKVGHVMSWLVEPPSADFTYQFLNATGKVIWQFDGTQNAGVISDARRITADGTYTLRIAPRGAATQVSFALAVMNANRSTLQSLSSGSQISANFTTNLRDYMKAKVRLNAGERIDLQRPSDSNIKLCLLDSYSRVQSCSTGLALSFLAPKTDDYYLFAFNSKGWGSGYSSSVSITSTSPRSIRAIEPAWPVGPTDTRASAAQN